MPVLCSLKSSVVILLRLFARSLAARRASATMRSLGPQSSALPVSTTTTSPGLTFLPFGNLTLFALPKKKPQINFHKINKNIENKMQLQDMQNPKKDVLKRKKGGEREREIKYAGGLLESSSSVEKERLR